jgi:preprotein translocase subunit SecE
MSEGMRDKELSLRCKAVKWVSDHKDELKLLTFPIREKKTRKDYIVVSIIICPWTKSRFRCFD